MRIVIISNRLPVTVHENENQIELQQSIGGVATGLHSYLSHLKTTVSNAEYLWIGCPGVVSIDYEQELTEKLATINSYPVFLNKKLIEKFYNGFCNRTLWPLCHYHLFYSVFVNAHWQAYKQVNELYCKTIVNLLRPGDLIWIHDYHLMLLPSLIRKACPEASIGFFFHIPFPSYEVFQFLPKKCREQLLGGMLGANLIGFHTHEYCDNFLKSANHALNYDSRMGWISTPDNYVKIENFPMGIDVNYFENKVKSENVIHEKIDLLKNFKNVKIILSIDRLDYTKGIINRLKAYEMFLQKNKQWHKKVVMVLIVAPSREKVCHYHETQKKIEELVGHINGKFSEMNWSPILYQYKAFTQEYLTALYAISDVALITPLRDGMNLIAKEYIASKTDNKGCLILSETAGAAKELLEAIIINPNCKYEIIAALKTALEMKEEQKMQMMQAMRNRIKIHDVINWGNRFITDLTEICHQHTTLTNIIMNEAIFNDMKDHYHKSQHRLILLDYDGSLVPFVNKPHLAAPNDKLILFLNKLVNDPKNKVIIVSGRHKDNLAKWLNIEKLKIAAEHGAWIKENETWVQSKALNVKWKSLIIPIMEKFVSMLEGTFIEVKDFSLVWHYRNADKNVSASLAKYLIEELQSFTAKTDVNIVAGNKIIEAKCGGIGKDYAVSHFLKQQSYDFILAVGDDCTDEDMFFSLPSEAYSIKVGSDFSFAKYKIEHQNEIVPFLISLSEERVEASA